MRTHRKSVSFLLLLTTLGLLAASAAIAEPPSKITFYVF